MTRKESSKAYYEKNKPRILEHNKKYYSLNRDEILKKRKLKRYYSLMPIWTANYETEINITCNDCKYQNKLGACPFLYPKHLTEYNICPCEKFEPKPSFRLQQIGIAIFKFICNPLKFISWRR